MGRKTKHDPIAITGMHRSGTSMITRALHDSGLHLIGAGAEDLIDAAEDNPEGFWENKAIVACNDELLEATGGSWDNPPDLPPGAVDDPRVMHVNDASSAALAALSEHDHWGFKDPRTCLTAGYWLDLQPDLRFVICVRHPLEVALSLKRRNQNSYSLGLALWERYYATVLDLVPPERRIVTHYDTFFVDPAGEIERLCAFAGLDPAPPRVRTDLRHHTIQVSLVDAGVSSSLRSLYADLCRQAGVALGPEPASDEGRVRRLVLDGAVAQRHADQRQDAVDRLQERERELRDTYAAREIALAQRVRELEQQMLRERNAAEAQHRERIRDLETQYTARLERLQAEAMQTMQGLTESVTRTDAAVANIDARTRTTATRLELVVAATEAGPIRIQARRTAGRAVRGFRRFVSRPGRQVVDKGRKSAAPAARIAVEQLPAPARVQLRRARNLFRRGVADPVPTARAVGRKLAPRVRIATERLPTPAQKTVQAGVVRVRRVRKDPKTAARTASRRLPAPAQQLLRRSWRAASRFRITGAASVAAEPGPKAAPTPKGPALREWRDAYEAMVAAAVPSGVPWLVVMPGSPKEVGDVAAKSTTFPHTRQGKPFPDDLAHIAHLEALRFGGHRYLVLPEGSRPWFRQQAELRDHVARTYRTVVDQEGAGAVFDLSEAASAGSRSLLGEVNRLASGIGHIPAVLDWTSFGVAGELTGFATFRSPDDVRLPYLDHSVDVVVLDATHDLDEARRVASLGVIAVAASGSGAEVRDVEIREPVAEGATPAAGLVESSALVWSGPGNDDTWTTRLAERVAAAGAELHVGEIDAAIAGTLGRHDVVVFVEPNVMPLPGAIEAAVALAAADPMVVVAGKVVRDDGRLESAGGIVFADRSVGLIAAASADVRAPWHDYVRAVCWAPGIVAASAALIARVPGPEALTGRAYVREWCAEVWASGGAVVYQPTVAAVRVTGNGAEPSVPLRDSAWQRVLDLRPQRPGDLSDGAWRYLIARDDVEACRG